MPAQLASVLAENIRVERYRKRLRQADVAEALGVAINVISELEAGKRPLRFDELLPLCRVLDVTFPMLLAGLPEEDLRTLGL